MNSSPVEIQTLTARMEKLESANRRWKSASAIALLFVVSMLVLSTRHARRVTAAARPDRIEPDVLHARTIEAQDFVLKDPEGHVYARFSITPNLAAADQNGRSPRLYKMPLIPGQASLQFYDEKGKVVWSAPAKPQFMTIR
ncbi:MAG: hypothetical protein DMG40_03905 [Acidobacteria bacterium]|nr:MAG: hypothetical protein DMG40_03905 [Acidobacteriota bacterium]